MGKKNPAVRAVSKDQSIMNKTTVLSIKIKRFLTFSAAVLCMAALVSCSGGKTPAESTESASRTAAGQTDTVSVSESEETTEQPGETAPAETEAAEEQTEAPAETEPPAETVTEEAKAPEPIVTVVEDDGKSKISVPGLPKNTYVNPLTGLVCTKERAELRPVAIMLNNIRQALPQQNIAAADILYECEVEGGLTRLLGIYNDYADLKAIGSIRSSREYYIDFAANHDAIYVHAGGSDSAYANLKQRKTNNLDGVNGGEVTSYFYRDSYRRNTLGMSLEHTLVIDGSRLNEAIAYKKYRQTYAQSFENPMKFVGPDQTLKLKNGTAVSTAYVSFAAHQTVFTYDASSNTWLRSQNGYAQVDGVTGEQLAYENVVVLGCPYTYTNDEKNHITVSDTGSGKGWYLTGGKCVSVNWSKASGDTPFKLTYANGRDVVFTPGKTCFEIVSNVNKLTVTS